MGGDVVAFAPHAEAADVGFDASVCMGSKNPLCVQLPSHRGCWCSFDCILWLFWRRFARSEHFDVVTVPSSATTLHRGTPATVRTPVVARYAAARAMPC